MIKHEIYSIAFDKRKNERGEIRANIYTVGQVSAYILKKPKKIEAKGGKITVTFEDNTRHIMSADGVEIFDRVITPNKPAKDEKNK